MQRRNKKAGRAISLLLLLAALGCYSRSAGGKEPAANTEVTEAKVPLLSWRVYLLPELGENNLFDQFKLDEPWNSPHNKKLISKMPNVYRTGTSLPAGKTTIVALMSEDSAVTNEKRVRFADITDGLSKTILYVEANRDCAVTWTKPEDIQFDPSSPLKCLGEKGHFHAVFCDGSVHRIPATIDAETMRRLVNRRDGKFVDLNF